MKNSPEQTEVERILSQLEHIINATPTGELREQLTEVNIILQHLVQNQLKWTSVEDGMPPDDTDVLIDSGDFVKMSWYGKRTKNDFSGFRFIGKMKVIKWILFSDILKHNNLIKE